MTNLLFVIVVTTNWVNLAGDFKRESGTNYVRQTQVVQTNIFVEEVTLCTNRTHFKMIQGTGGPVRWQSVNLPPGVPGRL
jgi:hypothetical protein